MEYLDEELEPDPQLLKLTNAIIGAAIAVHSQLGAGLDESTYDKALALEFAARGIPFISQHIIRVIYRGQEVGQYRLDFLVADAVVVEIKSVDSLAPIHTAQVISYLKATKFKLAILINFNVRLLKDGIKRVSL